jgi:uncharacterized Zn finger protein
VPDNLSSALNDMVIRRLADERTYQRGSDYFSHGHVESLDDDSSTVRAIVRSTLDYTVTLTANDGLVDYACDCPWVSTALSVSIASRSPLPG